METSVRSLEQFQDTVETRTHDFLRKVLAHVYVLEAAFQGYPLERRRFLQDRGVDPDDGHLRNPFVAERMRTTLLGASVRSAQALDQIGRRR